MNEEKHVKDMAKKEHEPKVAREPRVKDAALAKELPSRIRNEDVADKDYYRLARGARARGNERAARKLEHVGDEEHHHGHELDDLKRDARKKVD